MNAASNLIAELEELEKKATPGPLTMGTPDKDGDVCIRDESGQVVIMTTTAYAALIVAMRNALPELLQKIQQLESMTDFLAVGCEVLPEVYDERDAAIARAKRAEAALKFLARAKCMKGVVSGHLDDPEGWIKAAYEWADHEAAKEKREEA